MGTYICCDASSSAMRQSYRIMYEYSHTMPRPPDSSSSSIVQTRNQKSRLSLAAAKISSAMLDTLSVHGTVHAIILPFGGLVMCKILSSNCFLLTILAGERFLKLFEDADSVPSRLKVRKINQTVGDAMQGIPQTSQITGKKGGFVVSMYRMIKNQGMHGIIKTCLYLFGMKSGPLALVGLDSPSTLKKTSQSLSLKRPLNEIEEIIFTHGSRQPKVSAASTSGYRQAGIHPHQPQPSSTMDMKAERRAFMSHKVHTQLHAYIRIVIARIHKWF